MTLFNRPFPSALKKNQEKIQEPEEMKAVPRNILYKAQKDNNTNSILRKVTFSEERSTRSEEIGHKFPRAETTPAKTFSTVQSFGWVYPPDVPPIRSAPYGQSVVSRYSGIIVGFRTSARPATWTPACRVSWFWLTLWKISVHWRRIGETFLEPKC